MDVITIESQAYKDLVTKINAIAKFVVDHQDLNTPHSSGHCPEFCVNDN